MTTDKPTGVDLARVALAAAKKAAKERGAHTSAKRTVKRRPATRGDGREPMGLGSALAQLVTERGWEAPAAGGSVIDRWHTIVTPDIADNLRAVAYDPHTGRLDLLPATQAWATQARLISAQLIRQANSAVGTTTVRQIRVLPAGSRRTPAAEVPAEPAAPIARGEIRTRETASDGYRQAQAAISPVLAEPTGGPVRTRDDGCDGYQQARALIRTLPATPAEPTPVRTRDDGCDGYRKALANIGAPVPDLEQPKAQAHTRKSAGYQLARRAHLEGKSRSRARTT
ncbi:DciA family protein [Streptomyces marianii]|uniref:DciA family protein n=1 Tax=Streptomyces marianii TaxID=1817406 RepID=UPI00148702A6|nr:DciA family protein [Streptomyces marianii]